MTKKTTQSEHCQHIAFAGHGLAHAHFLHDFDIGRTSIVELLIRINQGICNCAWLNFFHSFCYYRHIQISGNIPDHSFAAGNIDLYPKKWTLVSVHFLGYRSERCFLNEVRTFFEQRKSGRGVWGEFRFYFAKPNWGQHRHLPEYLEGRTPQKNTLFIRRKRNPARAKWKEQRVFFCGVASLSSSGGAGFLIGGFARKKFEHQSKNTANFHFLWNRKKQPRRKAPRHGIFPLFWRHFWNPKQKCGRQCGSSCAKAQRKRSFQNQSFFFRFQRKVERIFRLPKN